MSRRLGKLIKSAQLIMILILATFILSPTNAIVTYAQSPNPTLSFIDVTPTSRTAPKGASGIVVEGLYTCSGRSESSIASSTEYWLNNGWYTWTELSIWSPCTSISAYESEISKIITDVENSGAPASTYWLGIMVDEESAWGFTASQLEGLNSYLVAKVANTPGITWWSAESFSGQGDWSQSTFNNITSSSIPSPEIATNYMVTLTNSLQGSSGDHILVTWSATYPSPYNTESYSDGKINGTPYYPSSHPSWYFDNKFVSN